MKRIYKYPLELSDVAEVSLPRGAKILHVGEQQGELRLWALGDPSVASERRRFRVVGTGHPADGLEVMKHLGTIQSPSGLVWHVFE